jgi:hypothetical protein
MFQLVFVLLALAGASIHIAFSSRRRIRRAVIAETYLIYFLFIYVHVFRPVQTSATIGWQPSPYEYEVGMADLTVGVLGVLCLWFRGNFWLATAIANATWLLGDAVGHIREMVIAKNYAPNNSGIFLVAEIVTPLMIFFLALYHRRAMSRPDIH